MLQTMQCRATPTSRSPIWSPLPQPPGSLSLKASSGRSRLLAFGAAVPRELLLCLLACQRRAHHAPAFHGVSVVVHADAASEALGPRAVFGNFNLVAPAHSAAGARVRAASEREGRHTRHRRALRALASRYVRFELCNFYLAPHDSGEQHDGRGAHDCCLSQSWTTR